MKEEQVRYWSPLTRFVLYPLLKFLRSFKGVVEQLIQRKERVSASEMLEEELQSLISDGRLEGVMDKDDEERLQSVLEFSDTLAKEVMVPRMDMTALEIRTPLEEVLRKVVEVEHTRLPVFRDNMDHIVGILHSKDLIKVWQSGKGDTSIRELLRPVIFFPENEKVSVLLREMRKSRTHLAIVVDEFGGTAGLITLEDLVEEIIGEVGDEFDTGEEELLRRMDEGWLVDSRIGTWELADKLDIPESALEDMESDTVGGLMSELSGRLPRTGEEVTFGGYLFRIAATDGRRVTKVQVREQKE